LKSRLSILLLLAAALHCGANPPIALPIYIEDNHAGSFYWLAEHVDLDEEFTLIHFDAHSDASQVFDSDKIRERLRRVSSLEERQQLLQRWRAAGAIQCFNWIEPLMPAPISRVIWVHPPNSADRKEALEQLDAHLELAPRAAYRRLAVRVHPLVECRGEALDLRLRSKVEGQSIQLPENLLLASRLERTGGKLLSVALSHWPPQAWRLRNPGRHRNQSAIQADSP
jgi:hypothetical protein